jgi:hypothetical protein
MTKPAAAAKMTAEKVAGDHGESFIGRSPTYCHHWPVCHPSPIFPLKNRMTMWLSEEAISFNPYFRETAAPAQTPLTTTTTTCPHNHDYNDE